ncbi:MAG: RNA 2'-phosphotransferase, partial [Sciscionella sp.]
AYVAAVSDALNRNGLRTDSMEVRTVAAAIDEPRFELSDRKIRARYGHTRDVKIEYDETSNRPVLYHGTATKNLSKIFTEGEGLRAMGRQWVHMSSDPAHAMQTARRHGPGVILALDPHVSSESVFHAGGTVYLTSAVPATSLRVVSPTELFLASASQST